MPQTRWKGKQMFKRSDLRMPQNCQWQQWKEERSWRLNLVVWAVTFSPQEGGFVCFPFRFSRVERRCGNAQPHVDTTVQPYRSLQQLCVCVGQEKQEGPVVLLRSGPGSGGAGALCDPLLYLFLRNFPGFALKRARTSWTNVWLFGVAFPCSSG